jgi:hypothetical protein
MNESIKITFSPDGKVKIEGKEFHGSNCHQAMEFLNAALGRVKSEDLKPEALNQQNEQQNQIQ